MKKDRLKELIHICIKKLDKTATGRPLRVDTFMNRLKSTLNDIISLIYTIVRYIIESIFC